MADREKMYLEQNPPLDIDTDFRKLKPNRSFANAQRKYMKLSKKELV
ncbi:hypothetical protein [Lysinibacillus sphaericus]|nr:hypothetical protein [Lysinibacillus sp. SDF0037]